MFRTSELLYDTECDAINTRRRQIFILWNMLRPCAFCELMKSTELPSSRPTNATKTRVSVLSMRPLRIKPIVSSLLELRKYASCFVFLFKLGTVLSLFLFSVLHIVKLDNGFELELRTLQAATKNANIVHEFTVSLT